MDDPEVLVSTGWLAGALDAPDLRVLDASWYLPDMGRDAAGEFADAHIPGAAFFDIDALSDPESPLPHMLPPEAWLAPRLAALGLRDGDRVVVYDGAGLFSAARVWWMLSLLGRFASVAVLDGGLPKWRAEGHPLVAGPAGPALPREGAVTLTRRPGRLADAAAVAGARAAGTEVIDARPPARFRGEAAEPRPGLRAGHVPGSRNVFFKDLLNADGTMKAPEALRAAFEAAGVDLSRPAITSCGSGVTAAVLSLALARIGKRDHALYDGSWAEWGQETGMDSDRPVATGESDV
ncbi:3-mercaptopyruvate sulfurtransferase [Pseudoroseicyclus sp. CXY001]|uniref:3-mercaptopyruvate sulfurtransferase n=1 Tax=Pseudoroseicyclus sp. CXY001 TaxID=3242492 RepID=UPI003571016F